ncbi:MAG: ComEC/Rec2 family competence protein [Arcobacter butzleri]|nr:ComEC/Rec2 family competence protein [Arcobacteraceae bacterium]MDY0364948.1 ComEC/Rec2 family competence protein [Arcobacteraceae bacterium]NLO16964.1 ComEC/Rec2 family competence protein [Aliarcobacter butzleri]
MLKPLTLLNSKLEWIILLSSFAIIFAFNLFDRYQNYLEFKSDFYFDTKAIILNTYPKATYTLLKIQTDDFIAFTSTNNQNLSQYDHINISLISSDISFIGYLRGFLTKNFFIEKLEYSDDSISGFLANLISNQHQNQTMSMFYKALYLAIPPSKELINFFNNYGMSHLIAISGYHLGVLSVIFYFLFNLIYSPLHQKYLPYRNKKFDIMVAVIVVLFFYLLLIGMVASFLRSFIMFVFGFLLLRANIKILSFENLLLTLLVILTFFNHYIFSISLWFSAAGVFYIFLFIHYYKNINKYILFFFFNFWIYLSVNPITQYFFGAVSFYQLSSPFLSLVFTIFYPLSLFLHILGFGDSFDKLILLWFSYDVHKIDLFASIYFIIPYILLSLYAIYSKLAFRFVEICFVSFNLWLFVSLLL